MTGMFAHGAILAALLQRKETGRGQQIHCNLLSTQLAMLINIASNWLNAGVQGWFLAFVYQHILTISQTFPGRPLGTEHESIVPYQSFLTKDGRHYVVGAGNDAAFREVNFYQENHTQRHLLFFIFLIIYFLMKMNTSLPALHQNGDARVG
jgi:succinate---hydroxymethylglutarate CoA-transferase